MTGIKSYFGGVVIADPELLGGVPVFAGTRVPVEILFQYLPDMNGIEVFLDEFPSVSPAQVQELLAQLEQVFQAGRLENFHASIAG